MLKAVLVHPHPMPEMLDRIPLRALSNMTTVYHFLMATSSRITHHVTNLNSSQLNSNGQSQSQSNRTALGCGGTGDHGCALKSTFFILKACLLHRDAFDFVRVHVCVSLLLQGQFVWNSVVNETCSGHSLTHTPSAALCECVCVCVCDGGHEKGV